MDTLPAAAAGQTLLLPQHFSDVQASAQEFTRQGCAEGLEHVGSQQGWSSSNVVMLSTGAAVFGNSSLGQLISYALEHGLSLGGAAALAALDGPLPLADILASILALQTIASDWEQRIQERLAEYEKKESAEKSPVADQSTPANPPPDDEDPDDDWDEWDDYDEGPTNERVGKQKNHAPRDNQKQNEQVDRIVKDLGLSKAERRLLHDEITGQGYGYQEILEIAKEILGRR